jgi:hypothetical protein
MDPNQILTTFNLDDISSLSSIDIPVSPQQLEKLTLIGSLIHFINHFDNGVPF